MTDGAGRAGVNEEKIHVEAECGEGSNGASGVDVDGSPSEKAVGNTTSRSPKTAVHTTAATAEGNGRQPVFDSREVLLSSVADDVDVRAIIGLAPISAVPSGSSSSKPPRSGDGTAPAAGPVGSASNTATTRRVLRTSTTSASSSSKVVANGSKALESYKDGVSGLFLSREFDPFTRQCTVLKASHPTLQQLRSRRPASSSSTATRPDSNMTQGSSGTEPDESRGRPTRGRPAKGRTLSSTTTRSPAAMGRIGAERTGLLGLVLDGVEQSVDATEGNEPVEGDMMDVEMEESPMRSSRKRRGEESTEPRPPRARSRPKLSNSNSMAATAVVVTKQESKNLSLPPGRNTANDSSSIGSVSSRQEDDVKMEIPLDRRPRRLAMPPDTVRFNGSGHGVEHVITAAAEGSEGTTQTARTGGGAAAGKEKGSSRRMLVGDGGHEGEDDGDNGDGSERGSSGGAARAEIPSAHTAVGATHQADIPEMLTPAQQLAEQEVAKENNGGLGGELVRGISFCFSSHCTLPYRYFFQLVPRCCVPTIGYDMYDIRHVTATRLS